MLQDNATTPWSLLTMPDLHLSRLMLTTRISLQLSMRISQAKILGEPLSRCCTGMRTSVASYHIRLPRKSRIMANCWTQFNPLAHISFIRRATLQRVQISTTVISKQTGSYHVTSLGLDCHTQTSAIPTWLFVELHRRDSHNTPLEPLSQEASETFGILWPR